MKKATKRLLIPVLAFLAAAGVVYAMTPYLYPAFKSRQLQHHTDLFYSEISGLYKTANSETAPMPYEDLYEDLRAYNDALAEAKQADLTSRSAYQNSPFELADYGLPDNTFGVLKIPKMELEMPLYLGASDMNMANGAAVLAQTSVPIGGLDSNAVIAGHRGWRGAKYFMDIELLEPGDEIYITNLWETLTYRVVEIKIIYPDDVDAILIQPGRDLVTLLTCHPYASGGRFRYLVFCERVPDETPDKLTSFQKVKKGRNA